MRSSILIKCLPPYIMKWIVVSFLLEEHNRNNRLTSTCPWSNLSPVFGPSIKKENRNKRSDHLATRETLLKRRLQPSKWLYAELGYTCQAFSENRGSFSVAVPSSTEEKWCGSLFLYFSDVSVLSLPGQNIRTQPQVVIVKRKWKVIFRYIFVEISIETLAKWCFLRPRKLNTLRNIMGSHKWVVICLVIVQ